MATRVARRRKVVLPVTIIRNNGKEKQVAHTLDVTTTSARLGGVYTSIQPGEVIELHRGAVRARFRVVWIGAPQSPLVGQAGLQGLFTGKSLWGVDLPADEPDIAVDTEHVRSRYPLVRTAATAVEEPRWHKRLECAGTASVMAVGYKNPSFAEIKDISLGGIFVQTTTVFPVNTKVHLKMSVGGVSVEMSGIVRSSDPVAGMGIGFQRCSRENEDKLAIALQGLHGRSTPQPALEKKEKIHGLVLAVPTTR